MNERTSSGSFTPSTSAFLSRMGHLGFQVRGCISASSPISKRERKRSSSPGMSFGGEIAGNTICF